MAVKISKRTDSHRILVFNPGKRLMALFGSRLQAAKMMNVSTQGVLRACNGEAITTGGFYFREWTDDIEIDFYKEMGELTIMEYDELCGVERKLYRGARINRKNLPKTEKKIKPKTSTSRRHVHAG